MNLEQIRAKATAESGDIKAIEGVLSHRMENRIALRNCGRIDPDSIEDYILQGNGYSGLSKALGMRPAEVITELRKSGLRGRGGAGFPAAEKWRVCRDTGDGEKYIICDAIDADPRACTARLLLENDPHAVLEGVLTGAYAAGAGYGYICVNAGYNVAIEKLQKALEQMKDYGLLGDSILDSDFSFDIEIKKVPSFLVFGEETALIRFLEGKQAMPYLRPPYPAASGLEGKPTLVNNVETFAHVSAVFQNGAECYAEIGTEKSKGSKIISIAGNVVNPCTVEVPFGTVLQEIVMDIGGGAVEGKDIKAFQVGGPTGLYFSADSLDMSIDYEMMSEAGGMVGSGTIEVFDGDTCAVEMARDAMAYIQVESCGKCVFCREGSYQIADILNDIAGNKGKPEDIELLSEIGEGMKAGSICGLGRAAANPVLSSIELFRADYDAHIIGKKCPLNND